MNSMYNKELIRKNDLYVNRTHDRFLYNIRRLGTVIYVKFPYQIHESFVYLTHFHERYATGKFTSRYRISLLNFVEVGGLKRERERERVIQVKSNQPWPPLTKKGADREESYGQVLIPSFFSRVICMKLWRWVSAAALIAYFGGSLLVVSRFTLPDLSLQMTLPEHNLKWLDAMSDK